MANGSGASQCYTCWHFKYSENGRSCMKYDFVFPKTTYEILCRDHRRRFLKRLVTDWRAFVTFLVFGVPAIFIYTFTGGWLADLSRIRSRKKNLLPLVLYFYSYISKKTMQPLAPFSELQSPSFLMNVRLMVDMDYVQSIHLEPKTMANIPELTKDVMVEIEGQKIRFSWMGGSDVITCLDPENIQRLHDWPAALLYAQPATGTYRVMPRPF
jgi:hypothetical protein